MTKGFPKVSKVSEEGEGIPQPQEMDWKRK